MAKRGKINRSRARRDTIERPVRWRRYAQIGLIVCEDEKTEPYYFEQFRTGFPDETLFLRCVGTGRDALGVVEAAVAEKAQLSAQAGKEVDFVWVVFDKDSADENPSKVMRFQRAFELAEAHQIQVAYSNEVFELWLLLHLQTVDADQPIPRATIYQQLEQAIQCAKGDMTYTYQHGDPRVVDEVLTHGEEEVAIQRATALADCFRTQPPIQCNPSTQVHELVTALRAWIRFYNWTPDE
ncbi:MAG: RloB family protein [Bacteroidota bacterium]